MDALLAEPANGFTTEQKLLLKGFRQIVDGAEKARNIEELFALKAFYKKRFGEAVDVLEVQIPPKPKIGEWWRLHIMKIPRKMFEKNFSFELIKMLWNSENRFVSPKRRDEVERYCQTLESVGRTAAYRPYAVWLPDRSKAPEEVFQGFDWTLEEALLDELMFFQENGKFFGKGKEVVCYGTVDHIGDFPAVYRDANNWHLFVKPEKTTRG